MILYVLIWGGGDLASGVALRLHRVGLRLLVVENSQPMTVRRSVAFAQAVFDGEVLIEGVTGKLINNPREMQDLWEQGIIPVLVDPELSLLDAHQPLVLVDARMRKKYSALSLETAELIVGLGPGFVAGENCHAAVETNRGHYLGRVYWKGSPQADTGIPGRVLSYAAERVLYAPADGEVRTKVNIGVLVNEGDPILVVDTQVVLAPFSGVVRGLIHDGVHVQKGTKVGDIDPRPDVSRCWFVSEKSLAIGGGVLEALLTQELIRSQLWKV